jgi:hypothetical protein
MSDSCDSESEPTGPVIVMGVNVTDYNKPDYNNPEVIEHQKSFEEWLDSSYINCNTSFVLTKD